jgi:hypothetical protein
MKYIYHHLGLGDHIICNGLIRSLLKKNENYTMFVKPHNLPSVSFMYKDLKNLKFIEGDDTFVHDFFKKFNIKDQDKIIIGFMSHPSAKEFDDSFYLQKNIPFKYRWSKFQCERDTYREKKLFNTFNVEEKKYVFIHDDKKRNFEIDEKYIINKNLPIIRPNIELTNCIFDYCYLMENSIESHFIDSCFRLIFDSFSKRNDDIFFHINLKNNIIKDRSTKSHSKLKFNII